MPCGQSFKDDIWLSFRNDICTLSLKWYMTVSSKGATALSVFLKWYFERNCLLHAYGVFRVLADWILPKFNRQELGWKKVCYPFEMIYDFHFEMSDSDHNRFEMIYLLSFRNEQYSSVFISIWYMTVISKWPRKIFVQRIIFVRKNAMYSRDENHP